MNVSEFMSGESFILNVIFIVIEFKSRNGIISISITVTLGSSARIASLIFPLISSISPGVRFSNKRAVILPPYNSSKNFSPLLVKTKFLRALFIASSFLRTDTFLVTG